jgi:hypothetical protein
MALFGRKKPSSEGALSHSEELTTHEPRVVEPSEAWLDGVDLVSQIKFVRRGQIVLVAAATSTVGHYEINNGRPDLEPRFVAQDDDSVVDAGYLALNHDEDREWDVKVDRFSGTYGRGSRDVRKISAEVLRGYLPSLRVTTDDDLNET